MREESGAVQVVTLEEVQARLTAWRCEAHRTRRIPDELWEAAVSLCGEHSICKVSRALGLDYKALRRRCRKTEAACPGSPFVELGTLWNQGEVFVECDDGHQRQIRIHCKGAVGSGVVDLVRSFFEGRR